jgi:hypothetical protein
MKKLGLALLLAVLVGLPAMLVLGWIGLGIFIPVGVLWLLGSFVIIFGPETITEITLWKASIKRDVKAAGEIRDEVEKIREELRQVTKGIVEESYILASCSMLAIQGAESAARSRLEKNLAELSKFAEPIKEKEDRWWKELRKVFANRRATDSVESEKDA